jgi:hypothetical protein
MFTLYKPYFIPQVMKFSLIAFFSLFTLAIVSLSCEKELVNKPPQIQLINTNLNIQFPLDSVELTATISDPDDKVVTVHWSKITGEGTLTIDNPDMLTTWVKGLKEGEYVFQLKATDGHGVSSFDTITIICTPPEVFTTTINPHNNLDEVHLFGNNTTIDQTDPAAPELVGGSGTFNGDAVDIRALLKFDLSTLPENAVIYNAKLTLFSNHTPLNGQNNLANVGTDNALYIQRVTTEWTPTSVNWTSQPSATTDDQVLIPHTDLGFLDLVDVDVTKLVTVMRAENSNNGFLLRLKNESAYNFRVFCSSKYSDQTKHPKLELSYYIKN